MHVEAWSDLLRWQGHRDIKCGCTDSRYFGGCEMSSHGAPSTDSGHMSTKHPVSQSSDYNGIHINELRREDVTGKEFKMIELAEEYYMSYAKTIGFSVRNDILVSNTEGKVSRRRCVVQKKA
ncbi:protein FAR1-RELATED SEQUENCE 5-like [Prunus yedoensis var. nudiflora]|uniref:Protein FAR1-RELATED SEQUENCE 5-like n=1 Tax=Prunus yedoensis var. nudiflora TaxID=2094558 RepID=A0A314ZQR2_PRUYE|nr:protein FAR1-RELATED SEQUENCE 5-like [Prunus yedoensis var. nudiflora]